MLEREFNRVFASNLKEKLEQSGMTRADFAKKMGVAVSSVGFWTAGAKTPRMDKIDRMCEIFNCKRSDLLEEHTPDDPPRSLLKDRALPVIPPYDDLFPAEVKSLPVLGYVVCGDPSPAEEHIEFYQKVGVEVDATFVLQAVGDSMINARIHHGDLVFIKVTDHVENGQIAVVRIRDETTLKRFYYYPQVHQIILRPENPAYSEIVYTDEEINEVKLIGRAVAVQCAVR